MAHAEHHEHDDHDEAHDDHHEPPPPEEPHSPWWLPLLGAILFLSGGVLFLVMNAEPSEEKKPADAPAATATAAQAAPPEGRPAGTPVAPRPAITAIPALRKAVEDAKR